jgi:hypothetical protein
MESEFNVLTCTLVGEVDSLALVTFFVYFIAILSSLCLC